MDKSWIAKPRNSYEYIVGLENFLDFAFQHGAIGNSKIICPCPSCGFRKWHARKDVRDHLLYKPFPKNYVVWNFHGEKEVTEFSTSAHVMRETLATEHPLDNMVNDAFGIHMDQESGEDSGMEDFVNDEPTENHRDFDEFLKEGNQKLQEGSDFTKLEFIVKLYHIKVLCGLSDKAITMILELVRDAFSCVNLPTTFDQAKKLIQKLSLNYVKIDACPNDCMLFEDEDPNNIQQTCSHCGASRWNSKKKKKKKQAAKVLRYFPLKPRLQRLFMCRKTAEHMLWHATAKGENDKMVHPRDGEAWKTFDLTHREFGLQPRNVRLGLASDGFNPYRSMSSTHSIWPVFLIPYNLPPWMCMKHTSFILSMVIPGKHSPGNNIDIYLKPLVRELKELWDEGLEIYDASEHKMFKIHAALIWTVSDFPGLSMLSGWNTYTGLACPTCNFDAKPCYLNHSKKWCYIGHRRFLGRQHRFRLSRVRFDGHTEERDTPTILSGSKILAQVENIDVTFGKKEKLNKKGKRGRQATIQWRKRSIFFELPYWKTNLLRHNLDFMHIEKNVCDNILYTLLNEKSKTKDNLNARKDLQDMGIRRDLWPDDNGKYHLALYSLTRDAKKVFLATLKNVRVPDGYSSNISRCIDEAQQKIIGLKSHDCHILIEQLLPLAIRNVLPNQVTSVLIEFCSFFRILCGKSLSRTELDKLQDRIVITLCHLEMLFPPSFFTVMVHLTVHLVEEAKLGGPVHYRYMYPIERELGHLKSFVRNKAHPEGSIAEGYLAEESLTFCSRYIDDMEIRFNRPSRLCYDPPYEMSSVLPKLGTPHGGHSNFNLTKIEKLQAHHYVVFNREGVKPYINAFRDHIRRTSKGRRLSPAEIEKKVNKDFVDWFQALSVNPDNPYEMSTNIKFLARGPMMNARRFSVYDINGYRFRTLTREFGLKTQNSGVFLVSNTPCIASIADRNMRQANLPYYGKLEDIIELNYHGQFAVVLFKCKWADTTRDRGYKKDHWNFNCVNFDRLIHTGEREEHEPYIEASQAQMVYYVDDMVNKGWSIAVHVKPRDMYDMGQGNEDIVYENEPYQEQELEQLFDPNNEYIQLATNLLDSDAIEDNVATNLARDMFE